MRILIYIIFLILFSNFIYSQTYINEINFINDEFVELYSNTQLNLSNNKIFDENGASKFNTLSLLKTKNDSNFYLIVGTNFASNNDLSNLNCTIYTTDKSQISNGGLVSSGENLTIQITNTTNISWIKTQDYIFQTGQSLNFNSSNNNFFISKSSPCLEKSLEEISNLTKTCNYQFKIIPKKDVFENKIEYEFETNATNFEIDYWIEDYDNNIIKNKQTTTNNNKKSYTPKIDYSQIFNLNAILKKDDCQIETSKYVFFYSKNQEEVITKIENQNSNSQIKIINQDSLVNLLTNELRYQIYRGDTLKRTIYFYLNSKIVHSIEIDKYSDVKGKIELNLLPGENNIIIKGLDEEETLTIFNKQKSNNLATKEIPSKEKQYFNITNFSINNSLISFNINSNIDNLTQICYINYIKTKVSNVANSSLINLTLQINDSQLYEKSQTKTNSLTLTCKYKKAELKTYNYYSQDFNYTINFPNTNQQLETNKDYFTNNEYINDTQYSKTLSKTQETKYHQNNVSENYESKNQTSKLNSVYFILLGVVLLLTILIIKW